MREDDRKYVEEIRKQNDSKPAMAWRVDIHELLAIIDRMQAAEDILRVHVSVIEGQRVSSKEESSVASTLLALAETGFGYDLTDYDKHVLVNAARLLDPTSVKVAVCGNHKVFMGNLKAHNRIVHGVEL